MRSGRSERDHLPINAHRSQDFFAVVNVAMTAHGNVVVAGIVQQRITFVVMRDANRAGSALERTEIRRRIVMVMEVNDRHASSLRSCSGATTRNRSAPPPAICRAQLHSRADLRQPG